jgi:hypothetical protein
LSDVEVEFGSEEMEHIVELELSVPGTEMDIRVSLVQYSAVTEVHVVPLSEIVLVRNGLPVVRVTVVLDIGVWVGGECQDVTGLRTTNPVSESTISQTLNVTVVIVIVDGESETSAPDLLNFRLSPLEPTAHGILVGEHGNVIGDGLTVIKWNVLVVFFTKSVVDSLSCAFGAVFSRNRVARQNEVMEIISSADHMFFTHKGLDSTELTVEW